MGWFVIHQKCPVMSAPVCIITGASEGIASAIARELSAQDYRLILLSRSGCGELAEELNQTGLPDRS